MPSNSLLQVKAKLRSSVEDVEFELSRHGIIMMLSVNSNVVANLFCKHVIEFAGVMLGSKLLVKIAYPARNLVGRIVG